MAKLSQRVAARGMGAGMGGGGHANNPTFMFQVCPVVAPPLSAAALALMLPASLPASPPQSDFAKNKWKGAVFVSTVTILGIWVPWKCVCFAQKKAGVW